MNVLIRILTASLVCIVATTACSKELTPIEKAVYAADPRNAAVHFTLMTSENDLRMCIQNIDETASAMSAFRVLLESADQLKDRSFDKVFMCFRDKDKFVLGGADYKTMGKDYKTQNVMYTIRTFPEKLTTPDGKRAFETRAGGVLYLMRVQMEDFNNMNKAWFLDTIVAEAKAKNDAAKPKVFAKDSDAF